MNGDSLQIMQAISDMRSELGERIGDMKASVAGLDGKFESALIASKEAAEAFRNELLGEGGRIVALEEKRKSDDKRHWITTSLLPPLQLALHVIVNKFGGHI